MRRTIILKERYPLDAPITAIGLELELDDEGALGRTWARSLSCTSHDKVRLAPERLLEIWSGLEALGALTLASPDVPEDSEGLRAISLDLAWDDGSHSIEGWELRTLSPYSEMIQLLEEPVAESLTRVRQSADPGADGVESPT